MVELAEVLADLTAESADADRLVAHLPGPDWARPTPAAGWTIAHQIAHLAWTDSVSLLAITDPDGFLARLADTLDHPATYIDRGAAESLDEPVALLDRWRAGRAALAEALAPAPVGRKIPWFGTAMSPTSMATARIMETWAHGLDIAEALEATRSPTARLRHVAYLGHRTLGHSFVAHGRPAPSDHVQLRLDAPDGSLWTFGPGAAGNRISGPALDFCLLVTQRRHRSDLALVAVGSIAEEWLEVAQVFAGPPGKGRPPRGAPAEAGP